MDFSNYKFRCSALGNIVSKSGKFTDGNKTYIEEVFIGELYGVRKESYGKAIEKGKYCEEDGITMLNKAIYPGSIVIKNRIDQMEIKGMARFIYLLPANPIPPLF